MPSNLVYKLLNYLPQRLKDYAANNLDRSYEELYSYCGEHRVELSAQQQDKIMIACYLNFLEEIFVNSQKSYQESFRFLAQSDVHAIRFGSRVYKSNDSLAREWSEFTQVYRELRFQLQPLGIPSGKTIDSLVEEIRWKDGNY
jgi:hypothetical protein